MYHRFQGIQNLTKICAQLGVHRAVLSPGSRNAPLLKAFLQQSEIKCYSIVDERSAAYTAIGISLKKQAPVALVCTSGTAVLNYSPAIAEAYYQKIPLIIITADRPPEAIDVNENQVIRQHEVFRNFIKASYTLPVEISSNADLGTTNNIIIDAIKTAISNYSGPVHINVPLREPLYELLPESTDIQIDNSLPTNIKFELSRSTINKWNSYSKKLILLGSFSQIPENLTRSLDKLIHRDDVIICTENLSNYKNENAINALDLFFRKAFNDPKKYTPDIVITLGGQIVSKQVRLFLRNNNPFEHWHISKAEEKWDMFNVLTQNIVAEPEQFMEEVLKTPVADSDYKKTCISLKEQIGQKQQAYLSDINDFCDLKVFEILMTKTCIAPNVFLGNSSAVRYSQFFVPDNQQAYFANRGVSGIDGCLSTACGYSMETSKNVFIVLGDVSFVYDSNALWNKYLQGNLKIVVINNGGGDIFKMINTKESISDIEDHIVTPHQVDIEALSKAFGINYMCAKNDKELLIHTRNLQKKYEKPVLLEVVTKYANNSEIYKDFIKLISHG